MSELESGSMLIFYRGLSYDVSGHFGLEFMTREAEGMEVTCVQHPCGNKVQSRGTAAGKSSQYYG
jgi:hypothetical protein